MDDLCKLLFLFILVEHLLIGLIVFAFLDIRAKMPEFGVKDAAARSTYWGRVWKVLALIAIVVGVAALAIFWYATRGG